MKRIVAGVLLAALLSPLPAFAVDSDKAEYVGGTVTGVPEKTEGLLNTQSEQEILFAPSKGSPVKIPYPSITSLEYGQKAGRRVGAAILVSPVLLFSKKRKHYLTVSWKEKDKEQAAVFELGKNIVRTTLTVVEVRSGKKIEYQDEEARKAGRGN